MQEADVTILCLPDTAAIQAVEMMSGKDVRIIDASSAHRTADGWVYGFPELSPQQSQKISQANFVSNAGCFASGFIANIASITFAIMLKSPLKLLLIILHLFLEFLH